MLHLLPKLTFLSIIASGSSHIAGRDFTAITINGSDVPTTTDFPSPETTDTGSDIANAYSLYIQNCGASFQDAHDSAVAEYKSEFNKDPDDPNAPDFIAWAYTHFIPYQSAYQLCEDYESKYTQLLATFTPETPSDTDMPGNQTVLPASATGVRKGGNATGGTDKGRVQTGGASSIPKFTALLSMSAVAHVLMGYCSVTI
ncbi:hypothetical protein B0H11DRAFT_1906908 [Mycena galericulata]|nr:hypothetical protein B0H11DRAFT_1906908 [Mycena galericulata]